MRRAEKSHQFSRARWRKIRNFQFERDNKSQLLKYWREIFQMKHIFLTPFHSQSIASGTQSKICVHWGSCKMNYSSFGKHVYDYEIFFYCVVHGWISFVAKKKTNLFGTSSQFIYLFTSRSISLYVPPARLLRLSTLLLHHTTFILINLANNFLLCSSTHIYLLLLPIPDTG